MVNIGQPFFHLPKMDDNLFAKLWAKDGDCALGPQWWGEKQGSNASFSNARIWGSSGWRFWLSGSGCRVGGPSRFDRCFRLKNPLLCQQMVLGASTSHEHPYHSKISCDIARCVVPSMDCGPSKSVFRLFFLHQALFTFFAHLCRPEICRTLVRFVWYKTVSCRVSITFW